MSNNQTDISNQEYTHYHASLIYITQAKYGSDWASLKHFHHFTEIFFVTNGSGSFTVENQTFPISKNDMIIVSPHIYHHEDSSLEGALEYIALGVDDFTLIHDNKEIPYFLQKFNHYKDDIEIYLNNILKESQNKEYGYQNICQSLLNIILSKIIRHSKYTLDITHNQTVPLNREAYQIKDYIDNNYCENITLDLLAQITNLNKYYISHIFKDTLGISPINYLIQKRLNVCKSLLKTSSLSISEISEAVGFSSQSYFTQTFKRYTDLTPNQYRQIHTKNK